MCAFLCNAQNSFCIDTQRTTLRYQQDMGKLIEFREHSAKCQCLGCTDSWAV